MTLPIPESGLVIRYSYLWRADHLRGLEKSSKDRPCAIILTAKTDDDGITVIVLPITHNFPAEPRYALEIPQITKRRLGLDSERSWVVFSEANRFVWPGPDLRSLRGGDSSTVAYGMLPPKFFNVLRTRYLEAIKAYRTTTVLRSE